MIKSNHRHKRLLPVSYEVLLLVPFRHWLYLGLKLFPEDLMNPVLTKNFLRQSYIILVALKNFWQGKVWIRCFMLQLYYWWRNLFLTCCVKTKFGFWVLNNGSLRSAIISTISLIRIADSNWAAWYIFINGFVKLIPMWRLESSFRNSRINVRRPFYKIKIFWSQIHTLILIGFPLLAFAYLVREIKQFCHFDKIFAYEIFFDLHLYALVLSSIGAIVTEEISNVLNETGQFWKEHNVTIIWNTTRQSSVQFSDWTLVSPQDILHFLPGLIFSKRVVAISLPSVSAFIKNSTRFFQ